MKLLISRKLPATVLEAAAARFDLTLRETTGGMSAEEAASALGAYDVILPTLGDGFSAAAFKAAPEIRTKLLANFGAGYNHIDTAAAAAAGVMVSNTPGAVTEATADIALMLLLMTARRAGEGERMVRAGQWTGWQPTQLLGMHLTGKTLCVVGMGRIGQAVAKRAHHGFGMPIVYYSRSEKALPFSATRHDTLEAALAEADAVVIAVPGGGDTRHLIGHRALGAMQRHAILVNIARGDVIDEAALIAALRAGQIAGAGLDVYEFEPAVPEALIAMENVVLLPHLGTAALEVREAMGQMALENAVAVLDGRAPPNRVA